MSSLCYLFLGRSLSVFILPASWLCIALLLLMSWREVQETRNFVYRRTHSDSVILQEPISESHRPGCMIPVFLVFLSVISKSLHDCTTAKSTPSLSPSLRATLRDHHACSMPRNSCTAQHSAMSSSPRSVHLRWKRNACSTNNSLSPKPKRHRRRNRSACSNGVEAAKAEATSREKARARARKR